jgi:hypothetical protein
MSRNRMVRMWSGRRAVLAGLGALGASIAAPCAARLGAQERVDWPSGRDRLPGAGPPDSHAVLYERVANGVAPSRFEGYAEWRLETPQPRFSPVLETVLGASVVIPQRKLAMRWTLRRNDDKSLPASHTVEMMFTSPADFAHGGVENIAGMTVRTGDDTHRTPLAGITVKVTSSFFLVGLSPVDADRARNVALLRTHRWFDVPLLYDDGARGVLLFEKGPSGARAMNDAFTAWAGPPQPAPPSPALK